MIRDILNRKVIHPVLAAITAGLYPVLFYYSHNYFLINSWRHLGFFIVLFILSPIVIFLVAHRVSKYRAFSKFRPYIIPFLNVFTFLFFLELCLYASVQVGITIALFIVSILVAYFFHSHFKKVVVFQLLLVVIGIITLVPVLVKQMNYSNEWTELPDNIAEVKFKKTPNVYYIQPDGYVNFSELDKGYYKIDNSDFQQYLENKDFKIYNDIRSNYNATLVSNIATFNMKHHYHNSGFNFSETINGRDIIISKNAVLDIFKNNNYKTHYLAQWPYLLANHPKMGYDVCNYEYDDLSFIGTGFEEEMDLVVPVKKYIKEEKEKPKFFFIELFKPGHIAAQKADSKGAKAERQLWVDSLKVANKELKEIINVITEHDPDGLIMIMADHGGYVGLDYIMQIRSKIQERNKLYSIFSTNLAIRWPDGVVPEFDSKFKTGVNTFRILFSYLGEEMSYLDHLEEDASFIIINKKAPKGVYRCIDEDGNIVFQKL